MKTPKSAGKKKLPVVLNLNNISFNVKMGELSWLIFEPINFYKHQLLGELLAIIGPVGSGKVIFLYHLIIVFEYFLHLYIFVYLKSTLLLALIGELENYNGLVDVKGKIAYISQQPWVFTASIRQNIIFGNEYVKEKFDKVVEVCSLKKVTHLHRSQIF